MSRMDPLGESYAGGASAQADDTLSVSAALGVAKGALSRFKIRVIGEVSEVNVKNGYKLAYFTLKDEGASMPCKMWLNAYRATGVQLAVGQVVELSGSFDVYPARGTMDFMVTSITLAGEGYLRQQVEMLSRKLQAQGLMDPERKRALPPFPQRVGVVTSPRGDAVHDILRTLRDRYPLAQVLFAGVPVEGAGAARQMMEGMRLVVEAGAEVVILGRGGGSFENLLPFSDEKLAITISRCPVPVVTGIGHEPDTTIADLVADVRQATPTKAAMAVVPDRRQLERHLRAAASSLESQLERSLSVAQLQLRRLSERPLFQDPQSLFASDFQMVDTLHARLQRALPQAVDGRRQQLSSLGTRLQRAIPHNVQRDLVTAQSLRARVELAAPAAVQRQDDAARQLRRRLLQAGPRVTQQLASRRDELALRLHQQGDRMVGNAQSQVGVYAARLHDLSPLAILGRGYAIARDGQGRIVSSVGQVEPGQPLDLGVSDGTITCTVEDTNQTEFSVVAWKDE